MTVSRREWSAAIANFLNAKNAATLVSSAAESYNPNNIYTNTNSASSHQLFDQAERESSVLAKERDGEREDSLLSKLLQLFGSLRSKVLIYHSR